MSEDREITIDEWMTAVTTMGKLGGWSVNTRRSNVNSETHLMRKDGVLLILFARLSDGKPRMKQHLRPWDEWMDVREANTHVYVASVTPASKDALWACLVGGDELGVLEDPER